MKNDFWGQNSRKLIHRVPFVYKLCLKLVRDGGLIWYKALDSKDKYSSRIKELYNSSTKERCFIVGNGPSLRKDDLDKLVEEDCFATNKIFNIFNETAWRPKYYVVADWSGLDDDHAYIIDEVETAFLGDHFYRLHNIHKKNAIVFYGKRLLNTELESFEFSEDVSKEVVLGATVTYACIQIAVYLGYKEIYLLGIDHNFAYICEKNGRIIKNPNADVSHFFKEESSNAYADILGMNNAFIAAKKYIDNHNISIYNATRGGALELFPRVEFDSLF